MKQPSWQQLLLQVFIFFIFTKTSVVWSWVEKDFIYHWDPSTQEILPSFRILTNEAERILYLPRHGAARALPLVVNRLIDVAFIIS